VGGQAAGLVRVGTDAQVVGQLVIDVLMELPGGREGEPEAGHVRGGRSGVVEQVTDGGGVAAPVGHLALELVVAGGGQGVVLGPAVVGRGAPLAVEEPLAFQAVEGLVEWAPSSTRIPWPERSSISRAMP